MVAVTSMNLIDVESIVANIMLGDSVRSSRLVEQKSEQNAEITAFQALNTSLLSVASAADAISGSTSWVPASVSSTAQGWVRGCLRLPPWVLQWRVQLALELVPFVAIRPLPVNV